MHTHTRTRTYQRQDDIVVLLPLVPIHGLHRGREAKHGVGGAALPQDIADQALLPVVGGEDGDLFRWVPAEAQVHVEGGGVLGLAQVLYVFLLSACV